MGRGRGRIFLYVLLVNMVLTDISINFDVSGFYLDLKWQYAGQEKKNKTKSHYLIIVQRACVNNRFPSLVLLIVSLVNILNSFDARGFYLGLKWSGKQITPNKLAFCYNTIWPHLMYPIGRAVFVTMNTMFLVCIVIVFLC